MIENSLKEDLLRNNSEKTSKNSIKKYVIEKTEQLEKPFFEHTHGYIWGKNYLIPPFGSQLHAKIIYISSFSTALIFNLMQSFVKPDSDGKNYKEKIKIWVFLIVIFILIFNSILFLDCYYLIKHRKYSLKIFLFKIFDQIFWILFGLKFFEIEILQEKKFFEKIIFFYFLGYGFTMSIFSITGFYNFKKSKNDKTERRKFGGYDNIISGFWVLQRAPITLKILSIAPISENKFWVVFLPIEILMMVYIFLIFMDNQNDRVYTKILFFVVLGGIWGYFVSCLDFYFEKNMYRGFCLGFFWIFLVVFFGFFYRILSFYERIFADVRRILENNQEFLNI